MSYNIKEFLRIKNRYVTTSSICKSENVGFEITYDASVSPLDAARQVAEQAAHDVKVMEEYGGFDKPV